MSVPIEPIDETRLILRPTLAKKVVFFAGSALFVFVGVWMIRDGKPLGWLPTIFFGLCSIVFLIQLHPRASLLILTSEGFEVRALFLSYNYLWKDVSDFFVKRIALNSIDGDFFVKRIALNRVVFNFVDDYEPQPHMRKLDSTVPGAEAALPDTYGKKPEELLSILNAWKDRAKRST